MARGLMAALSGGAQIDLVSELQIYDGAGDADAQNALTQQAMAEADRLIKRAPARNWQAWISYHNYYKAPDIIGPIVSRALGIPYILIESTRAKKRLTGPWSGFAALAEAASDHADLIFYFTENDQSALEEFRPEGQRLVKLHPFLAQTTLPAAAPLIGNTILSVAMLRPGDKLASFQIIADVLPHLKAPDWQFQIAGDGPARADVKALFAPFKPRVTFLGQLDQAALTAAYHNASAFLWPGVNEAFGMVYLEAQAAGVPVIAQDRPGVRDVVAPDGLYATDLGPRAIAQAIDSVLLSESLRKSRGQISRTHIANNHLLETASQTLWSQINPLIKPA